MELETPTMIPNTRDKFTTIASELKVGMQLYILCHGLGYQWTPISTVSKAESGIKITTQAGTNTTLNPETEVETMPARPCPRCENGIETYDETIDRRVTDACYHCGKSGFLYEEQYQSDRQEEAIYAITCKLVAEELRDSGNEIAESCGENGITIRQYTQDLEYRRGQEVCDAILKLPDNIRLALVDTIVPLKPELRLTTTQTMREGYTFNAAHRYVAASGPAIILSESKDEDIPF